MLQRLLQSSLFRAASIYGASNLLRQALPVLLVPVLTRHLSPADYGTMALFGVAVNVFTPLVGINIHGAINRRYFDRQRLDLPAYVYSCLVIVAAATAVVALLLWPFGSWAATVSELPLRWLWVALFVASGQMVSTALLALLQAAGKPIPYSIIQIARTTLVAAATVGLVVVFHQDWRGSVWAQALGAGIFAIVGLIGFVQGEWLRPRFGKEHARHALAFGLPLIPHALSGVAIQAIDRLFVSHYAGLGQTGLYSLGYQLGMIIGLLEDSFDRAWQPWLFERLQDADDKAKRNIVRFTYGYFVVIAGGAILLGAIAPWLLSFVVSKQFHGASIHVVWIALGYAFNGMYKMVVGYIFYMERTALIGWLTLSAAAANIGLNWLLVPRFGAIGAAQATTGAFLVSFILTWIVAARVHPMPWMSPLRGSRASKAG
jgi:O-antigen/teichoic acid export membrane protein